MTGVVLACPCGEVYELRPEYAGQLLECPVCHRRLRATAVTAPRPPAPGADEAFERDVFLLRERVLTIRAKYEVWSAEGRPVLYVERPTYPVRTVFAYALAILAAWIVLGVIAQFGVGPTAPLIALLAYALAGSTFVAVSMSARPLRHVTVYRDDRRREILLRVLQDQRLAVLVRTYTVVMASGEPLARLSKNYVHNVLRKRWEVEIPPGHAVALAVEDSIVLSLLRRVLGTLFGVLRTNFLILGVDGNVLGELNRKFTIFDRYVLDLSADPARELDRRVAVALGVMLDTGERR
jgi:hypothetical protein